MRRVNIMRPGDTLITWLNVTLKLKHRESGTKSRIVIASQKTDVQEAIEEAMEKARQRWGTSKFKIKPIEVTQESRVVRAKKRKKQ